MKKIILSALPSLLLLTSRPVCCQEEKQGQVNEIQVTTSSGTTRIIARPRSAMVKTLSEQRQRIENIVDRAGTALPENVRAEVKSELSRIAAEEASLADDSSNKATSKMMGLARALDDVVFKINASLRKEVATPLVQGTQFAVMSGNWIDIDDIAMRRWDLEGRIAKAVDEGRLSRENAAQIRKTLDTIGEKESGMRADGDLDVKESRILYTEFDRVASQIDRMSKRRSGKK